MRLTNVVLRQHLGSFFKVFWWKQREQIIKSSEAHNVLKESGIKVFQPEEILGLPPKDREPEYKKILRKRGFPDYLPRPKNVTGLPVPHKDYDPDVHLSVNKVLQEEHANPNWHDEQCFKYHQRITFIEKLNQVKLLTNTVEIQEGLPAQLMETVGNTVINNQDELVKRVIKQALLFDSHQEKLPYILDTTFRLKPREYGVPKWRQNVNLTFGLQRLCGNVGLSSASRMHVDQAKIIGFVRKDNDLLNFNIQPSTLISSRQPLKPFADQNTIDSTADVALPDMYPMNSFVNLHPTNIYEDVEFFPVRKTSTHPYVHTVYFLYKAPIPKWKEGDNAAYLAAHTFFTALGQAYELYGKTVTELPEPVTIQGVFTNGKLFQFAAIQLNTADISGTSGKKNILWLSPPMDLYTQCEYVRGIPILEGYNPEVFQHLLALHLNA